MPVDEPQRKSETFRFRMSMALFKGRDGETSAATTGVEADVDPSSSGLIRDQCCKASAAGFMEGRPEEEGTSKVITSATFRVMITTCGLKVMGKKAEADKASNCFQPRRRTELAHVVRTSGCKCEASL